MMKHETCFGLGLIFRITLYYPTYSSSANEIIDSNQSLEVSSIWARTAMVTRTQSIGTSLVISNRVNPIKSNQSERGRSLPQLNHYLGDQIIEKPLA